MSSQINRTDIRSIRKWCKKNHLTIYKDSSGEFVIKHEFDLVYDMPVINGLKLRYGDSWQNYYRAYEDGELYKLLDLNTTTKIEKTGYVPKGDLSSKLFGGSSK